MDFFKKFEILVWFEQWFLTFLLACYEKILGTFSAFRKGTPVVNQVWNEKKTGNSGPKFLVLEVDFPKNPPDFKNLNKRQCQVFQQESHDKV